MAIAWDTNMKETKTVNSCSRCSLEVQSRVECVDCLHTLCATCWIQEKERAAWYEDHSKDHPMHKSYRFVLPKFTRIIPPDTWDCECATTYGCVIHCVRCFNGESFSSYLGLGAASLHFLIALISESRCLCYDYRLEHLLDLFSRLHPFHRCSSSQRPFLRKDCLVNILHQLSKLEIQSSTVLPVEQISASTWKSAKAVTRKKVQTMHPIPSNR